MTTPSLPTPPRPCRVCATPTTNPGQRCDTHTQQRNHDHNRRTAYYQTPEWRTLRDACLTRDYNQCVLCTSGGRLVAHHITPRKDGGRDALENLATLCHYCHNKLERGSRSHAERLAEHARNSPHHAA